ncbi:uncharacterized protein AB675_9366 [Cyphellophora attinorum]|uniref:Uncharacterized protein n=1 Tax=Cyphellophora attinorum TaxID=1664694 RepID=A0A0N1P046_9EURO|nr:uncharacterized protein AB675_9366 [Phialophora attinorum]KPI41686.1 hypothetical protein AB675_9366 [Phialophora attinorum]
MSSTPDMPSTKGGQVPTTCPDPATRQQPTNLSSSLGNSLSVSENPKNKKRKSMVDDEEETEVISEDESPMKRNKNCLQTGLVSESTPASNDLSEIARNGVRRAFIEGCLPTILMNGPRIVIDNTNSAAPDDGPHVRPFWTATYCLTGQTSMLTPGSRCGFGIVYQSLNGNDNDNDNTWWQDSFVDRSPGPASSVQASILAILNALRIALDQCERASDPDEPRSTRLTMPETITIFAESATALARIDAAWHDPSMHFLGRASYLRGLVQTIRSLGALGVKVQLCTSLGTREDPRHRWARRAARKALQPDSWTESATNASVQRVCRRSRRAER